MILEGKKMHCRVKYNIEVIIQIYKLIISYVIIAKAIKKAQNDTYIITETRPQVTDEHKFWINVKTE